MKTYAHLYLSEFFLECSIYETKFFEKIKTHVLNSKTLSDDHAVYKIMWKNMFYNF
jgi:hypothetical protein